MKRRSRDCGSRILSKVTNSHSTNKGPCHLGQHRHNDPVVTSQEDDSTEGSNGRHHWHLRKHLSSNLHDIQCKPQNYNKQPRASKVIGTAVSQSATPSKHQSTHLLSNLDGQLTNIPYTMCTATAFKCHTCQHRWLTIITPCGPGMGFDNCPRHAFNGETTFFGGPKFCWAPIHCCPVCGKGNHYDGNRTRMILRNGTDAYGAGGAYAGGGEYTYSRYEYGAGSGYPRRSYGGGYAPRRTEPMCCVVM